MFLSYSCLISFCLFVVCHFWSLAFLLPGYSIFRAFLLLSSLSSPPIYETIIRRITDTNAHTVSLPPSLLPLLTLTTPNSLPWFYAFSLI